MKNINFCMNNIKLCNIKRLMFAVFVMTVIALILPFYVHAEMQWNGCNYYLGVYYGESREKVDEMKDFIIGDGYVCVTRGEGHDDYCDVLEAGKDFYWYTSYLNDTYGDYYVYVPDREMQRFIRGEIGSWTINNCTVVLDYYTFNNTDDMSMHLSEEVGVENIPDEYSTGTISFITVAPEELASKSYLYSDCTITVMLHGEERNRDYMVELNGLNNYSLTETFIIDRYIIKSATINANGYAVVAPTEDYCRLAEGKNITFGLEIRDYEEYANELLSQSSPHREIQDTLVSDVQETAKKNPYTTIIVAFIILTLMITGLAPIINHMKRTRGL